MTTTLSLTIAEAQNNDRLDKALALLLKDSKTPLSRARIQALIKEGRVTINGKKAEDANAKIHTTDALTLTIPPPTPDKPAAQKMALDVIYEDKDLIVINKPVGLVVHPAAGHSDGTLVNALLAHCGKSLSGIGGVSRPGIVHRLDKDTSGLIVVAKNDQAHQALSAQFADRTLGRIYQALVWGVPSPMTGEIDAPIGRDAHNRQRMAIVHKGGKAALTKYEVIDAFENTASLVDCILATGRTHQIRVHMASIKHPIIGDPLYGRKRKSRDGEKTLLAALETFPRQALHAYEIHFKHPKTGKRMRFKAPLPDDLRALLKKLKACKNKE